MNSIESVLWRWSRSPLSPLATPTSATRPSSGWRAALRAKRSTSRPVGRRIADRHPPHRRVQRGVGHRRAICRTPWPCDYPDGQVRDRHRLGRLHRPDERDRPPVRRPRRPRCSRSTPTGGRRPSSTSPSPTTSGEVVVLSDANTHMAPDAVRRLAAWFARPGGRRRLRPAGPDRPADRAERRRPVLEVRDVPEEVREPARGPARVQRRHLRHPQGRCSRPSARQHPDRRLRDPARRQAADRAAGSSTTRRRSPPRRRPRRSGPSSAAGSRIGAGGFQSIGMLWPLLSPANGWVAFTFLCHKILRWVCPFFLLAALVANSPCCWATRCTRWLFAAQVGVLRRSRPAGTGSRPGPGACGTSGCRRCSRP